MSRDYLVQYLGVTLFAAMAVLVAAVPLLIVRLVAPRKPGPVKNDIYECGLTTKGDAWVQFRVGYYLYALVYVIFAVEAVFLYPWAVAFAGLDFGSFLLVMVFVLLLAEGLVYAWVKGALDWK